MNKPHEVELRLARQSNFLTKLTATVLAFVVFITLGSLIYGFQILHTLEDIDLRAPARMNEAITVLIEETDCANQENLEIAVNALLEQLQEQDSSIRLEFRDNCADRPFPEQFFYEDDAS